MKCKNCGAENQNDMICHECGWMLGEKSEQTSKNNEGNSCKKEIEKDNIKQGNPNNENDLYERELEKKKEKEQIIDGIIGLVLLVLCGSVVKNNWGYRDFGEVVIICILFLVVGVAISGAIKAILGVYNAEENLNNYIKLKKEVGRIEAIKITEQTKTNSREGFALLIAGIKGGFGLANVGIKGIFGFIITLLLLIIAISLC